MATESRVEAIADAIQNHTGLDEVEALHLGAIDAQ